MTRFISIFCLFVCFAPFCTAQLPFYERGYADSLNRILQKAATDSGKAKINFQLAIYWLPKDTVKAKQYLAEGRRQSKNYPLLEAISYSHEAYFYFNVNTARSEAAYLKADSLVSSLTTKEAYTIRSNAWQNYAILQQSKDDDEAYLDILLNKAIPLALQARDSSLLGFQYVSVGVAFMNTEQYAKAELYLNNAITALRSFRSQPSRLVVAYYRAGENFIYLKKYASAKLMLDSMKVILAPYPESELYAGYYLVEGLYYHHLRQYNNALTSFDKGIASAGGVNKAYRIQELQFLKVKTLLEKKSYDQAKQLLTTLSAQEAVMSLDDNRLQVYSGFAETYEGLGNLSVAHQWLKQYSQLSDSLHEARLKHDINALEIKYRNTENQKEIITLKASNEQTALSSKNAWLLTWLLASACVFLIIITALALLYYKNNKKLAARKINEIEQQKQLDITKAILDGEEQERKRLARDLHDGLGGMLAGVKMNLSGTVNNTQQTAADKEKLHQAIHQLDNSVNELRRIARNMMPESLLNFGLETALKDMCELSFIPGIDIHFQSLGIQPGIPEKTQLIVYRIAQELLANAIKHSGAGTVTLQCSQHESILYLTIEDNGKGFDTNTITRKGLGWDNIRNRVDFLHGKMEIDSVINEGTTINIEVNVSE